MDDDNRVLPNLNLMAGIDLESQIDAYGALIGGLSQVVLYYRCSSILHSFPP